MKLHQLPMGTRFEYEGQVFVKTGPVTAASEQGGSRMIPRYAVLKPLDGYTPPPPKPPRALEEANVLAAFEQFYQRAMRAADDAGRLDLARARQQFFSSLEITP